MSPLFEFVCKNCGLRFERILHQASRSTICPRCKKRRTKRVLSVPAIIFRGKGFHKTDYRKEKGIKAVKSEPKREKKKKEMRKK